MRKDLALVKPVNLELAKKLQGEEKKIGLEEFIDEFMGNFLSKDTKRAYQEDLSIFFGFLKSGGVVISHPSQITARHFQVYRDSMIEEGLAPATVNRRLVCIRSFMKWSMACKLIQYNPLDSIKLPKVSTQSPTVAFEDHEVVKMLNAPDLKTLTGRTHRFIMVMLFHLGLRRSELVHIKYKDIVQDRGHLILKIRGKGDKERILPINETIFLELKNYLNSLKEAGISLEADDYLIQTRNNKNNKEPADGSTIFRIINRYAKSLGINKKVSPHSCRATVISHLLDTQKTPIRDVAIFAGHAIISTTERYDKRRNNLDSSAAYQVKYVKKVS